MLTFLAFELCFFHFSFVIYDKDIFSLVCTLFGIVRILISALYDFIFSLSQNNCKW